MRLQRADAGNEARIRAREIGRSDAVHDVVAADADDDDVRARVREPGTCSRSTSAAVEPPIA